MAVVSWLQRNVAVYRGNAMAMKDFRAQLRGTKAIWLWTFYLLLLVAISLFAYSDIIGENSTSPAEIQNRLQTFYSIFIALLAGTITLVSPAFTAGAIIVEKQRKSLDLLFSAPVSYKSLLVGKMLATYRYIWMLLILSLPVVAMCVVMGGATWGDVLKVYALLSFCAIIFTSFGLLISSLTESVGAAIIWTYLGVIGYLIVTAGFATSAVVPAVMGRGGQEMSWAVTLNPFTAAFSGPTYSTVAGYEIPNVVFLGLAALVISKLCLIGAGSHFSTFKSAETKSLRIHALLFVFLISLLVSFATTNSGVAQVWGYDGLIVLLLGGVAPFLPHIVCFSPTADRKYRDDGNFSWRILDGSRSGAFVFLFLLLLLVVAGVAIGGRAGTSTGSIAATAFAGPGTSAASARKESFSVQIFLGASWAAGFVMLFWGIGRWVSSRSTALKSARAGLIATYIVLLGVPVPVLSIIEASRMMTAGVGDTSYWAVYVLYPLFYKEGSWAAPLYGAAMALVGVLFAAAQRKRRVPPVLVSYT